MNCLLEMAVKTLDKTFIDCNDGLISLSDHSTANDCAIKVKSTPGCSTKFFSSLKGLCACEKDKHNCKRIFRPDVGQYRLLNGKIYRMLDILPLKEYKIATIF